MLFSSPRYQSYLSYSNTYHSIMYYSKVVHQCRWRGSAGFVSRTSRDSQSSIHSEMRVSPSGPLPSFPSVVVYFPSPPRLQGSSSSLACELLERGLSYSSMCFDGPHRGPGTEWLCYSWGSFCRFNLWSQITGIWSRALSLTCIRTWPHSSLNLHVLSCKTGFMIEPISESCCEY